MQNYKAIHSLTQQRVPIEQMLQLKYILGVKDLLADTGAGENSKREELTIVLHLRTHLLMRLKKKE